MLNLTLNLPLLFSELCLPGLTCTKSGRTAWHQVSCFPKTDKVPSVPKMPHVESSVLAKVNLVSDKEDSNICSKFDNCIYFISLWIVLLQIWRPVYKEKGKYKWKKLTSVLAGRQGGPHHWPLFSHFRKIKTSSNTIGDSLPPSPMEREVAPPHKLL